MFFTFPEDARWNAKGQVVEFEIQIGGRDLCKDISRGAGYSSRERGTR